MQCSYLATNPGDKACTKEATRMAMPLDKEPFPVCDEHWQMLGDIGYELIEIPNDGE